MHARVQRPIGVLARGAGYIRVVRPRGRPVALAAVTALAVAGCGAAHHVNSDRPAAPLTITASINQHKVIVSPVSFGAGPIVILISNQSGRNQHVTFETNNAPGGPAGVKRSTSIASGNAGQIQITPNPGHYLLHTAASGMHGVSLVIGRKRPTDQNQVLEP